MEPKCKKLFAEMYVDFSAFSEALWIEWFISVKYLRDAEFNATTLIQAKISIDFMNLYIKMFSVRISDCAVRKSRW